MTLDTNAASAMIMPHICIRMKSPMLLLLVTLVVVSQLATLTLAYPSGAGGCPKGVPGVDAFNSYHLDDRMGARPVVGLDLASNNIEFRINGDTITPFTGGGGSSRLELFTLTSYKLEVVALNENQPFKGALISIDPGENGFVDLSPLENSNFAVACNLPRTGVTHFDASNKTVLSGEALFSQALSGVVVDVTVVNVNNDAQSIFAHNTFEFDVVSPEVPTPAVITSPPSITSQPSSTVPPTYEDVCYVCNNGDPTQRVTNPEQTLTFFGVLTNCGDVELLGLNRLAPPEVCGPAQRAVQESCICEVVTLAEEDESTDIPTQAPSPEEEEDTEAPSPEPPTLVPTSTDEDSTTANEFNTFEPTVSNPPTITPLPTFSEKCYVCGSETQRVTNPEATFAVQGMLYTCSEVEEAGLTGQLAPENCDLFSQPIQNGDCGCAEMMMDESLEPSTSPVPTTTGTFGPTITMLPTETGMPTYTETCYVCGDETLRITVPEATITVQGDVYPCGEVETAGLTNMIAPNLCREFSRAVQQPGACGCADAPAEPTPSPAPSPVYTYEPTVTAPPTLTSMPTFNEKCLVCGDELLRITRADTTIEVEGAVYTCGEVEEAGLNNMIAPDRCRQFSSAVQRGETCGCAPFEDTSVPATSAITFQPTLTMTPTMTAMPSYTEACYVCGDENLRISSLDTTITVQGDVFTCGEVEEAGLTRNMSPEMCVEFSAAVQEEGICGCAVPPSPSPTRSMTPTMVATFEPTNSAEPTITSVPTFSEICYGCGDGGLSQITNTTRIVPYMGFLYTCGTLASSQNLIAPSDCDEYVRVITKFCACQEIVSQPSGEPTMSSQPTSSAAPSLAPSISPQPTASSAPTTTPSPTVLAPTSMSSDSEAPSVSSVPTYEEQCLVCGGRNFEIENPRTVVTLGSGDDAVTFTCGEIADGAEQGIIPPQSCDAFIGFFERGECICVKSDPPSISPTVTPEPTTLRTPIPTEPPRTVIPTLDPPTSHAHSYSSMTLLKLGVLIVFGMVCY